MNEITMIGLISSKLKKNTETGLYNFGLMTVSPSNTDVSVRCRCVVNEKLSSTLNEQTYRIGSLIVIHGELRSYTKPNDSYTNFYNYIYINRIELLQRREVKLNFNFNKFMQQYDINKIDNMRKNLDKEIKERQKELNNKGE